MSFIHIIENVIEYLIRVFGFLGIWVWAVGVSKSIINFVKANLKYRKN
jgi:hypothetical protein